MLHHDASLALHKWSQNERKNIVTVQGTIAGLGQLKSKVIRCIMLKRFYFYLDVINKV